MWLIRSHYYLRYILVAGLMFGTYNRFTPEALGMLMSSAMAWMVLEVGAMLLSLYILAVSTGVETGDECMVSQCTNSNTRNLLSQ